MIRLGRINIVKTPTTTSIQLKKTSTAVGFDTIMTVHTTPSTTPPPGTLLQVRILSTAGQCNPILNNHPRLSETTILDYLRQLSSTIFDNYPQLS